MSLSEMGSLILIDLELNEVKSFLDRVYRSVDTEYGQVISRIEAGEFEDSEDEENAFFSPRTTEILAMKAALNEINSIVEWELFGFVAAPFSKEQSQKKKRKPRLVWDLKRDELHKLIENNHGIKLKELPGMKEVEELRATINAFKHRKGFKDPRKEKANGRHELRRELVADYLEGAKMFLRALYDRCKPD